MWWVFEAISTTSTLSFQSLSSGGAHGPALDNVRVTLVPEFSTGYFGIIAVLFGFLMRRHLR